MKPVAVIIICFLNILPLCAQKGIDTIFLSKDFAKVRKPKAEFYRYLIKDPITEEYKMMDYFMNGNLYRMGTYIDKNGKVPNGMVIKYYPNGNIKSQALYQMGILNGDLKTFYENGKVCRTEKYNQNKIVSGVYLTKDGKDTVLAPYFKLPVYKGGDDKLKAFLKSRMVYPPEAIRRDLEGMVTIGFIVPKKGQITHVGVISSTESTFNKEAERLITMTKYDWLPGLEEGEPADIAISYPIVFKKK